MASTYELLSDPAYGLVREARQSQLTMAASVEKVLGEGGAYFCEGPVGLGKSLAYLVPALLTAGRRIVVATAKKTLQDQLVGKDLPAIKQVLGPGLQPTLGKYKLATPLKGRGQYACRLSARKIIATAGDDGGEYNGFLHYSTYGDRADYGGMPPRWWSSASAEDCVGKRCEHFDDCGYIRLKRDVTQSKIIVVNHHVLGADMFFGHGKMIGGPFDVLIIDEAHALAAGIRSAYTCRIAEDSITSLLDLLRRTAHPFPSVRRLIDPWEAMFQNVPNRHWTEASACNVPVFSEASAEQVLDGLDGISEELSRLEKLYNTEADEPDPFADPEDLPDGQSVRGIEMDDSQLAVAEEGVAQALAVITQATRRVQTLRRGLNSAQGIVDADLTEADQEGRRARILANTAVFARQDERGRFGIDCAPVNLGGIMGRYLANIKTVILCSATLAIDGGFGHVSSMTGIVPVIAEVLPTSFNYDAQGFAFIPRDLPALARTHADYARVMQERVAMAVKLVELSDGGAFILTTANDELDAFAGALKLRFPGRAFAQGHRKNPWDGDPASALAKFKEVPNSILIGSKSFWEGVDVPGGALRLVIMAKLPFPQYNDPIIKARERLAGDDAFMNVQMVDMLIDLRQGVGRLIRSKDDRGCVAILDSRVWDKSYGGMVRRALPWSNNLVTSKMDICARYLPGIAAHFKRMAAAVASPDGEVQAGVAT